MGRSASFWSVPLTAVNAGRSAGCIATVPIEEEMQVIVVLEAGKRSLAEDHEVTVAKVKQ